MWFLQRNLTSVALKNLRMVCSRCTFLLPSVMLVDTLLELNAVKDTAPPKASLGVCVFVCSSVNVADPCQDLSGSLRMMIGIHFGILASAPFSSHLSHIWLHLLAPFAWTPGPEIVWGVGIV